MGVALYNDILFLVIESCKVEETVCLIKKSDANENFYSVEIHYHRYLSLYSLVVVAPSLTSFQKPQKPP